MRIRLAWALLLSACGGDDASPKQPDIPEGWGELVSFCGALSVHVPPGTSQERLMGIDSCVEGYAFASCNLVLDWGSFSDRLDNHDEEVDYERSEERIDGWRARLVTYRCESLYCAAVNLPTDQDISVTLSAQCGSYADRQQAVTMMRTLRVTD